MSRLSLLPVLLIAGLIPAALLAQGPPKAAGTDVVLESGGDGVPLPDGALHRFGNRRARHPDGIIASAVSPDGKLLATVGNRSVIV